MFIRVAYVLVSCYPLWLQTLFYYPVLVSCYLSELQTLRITGILVKKTNVRNLPWNGAHIEMRQFTELCRNAELFYCVFFNCIPFNETFSPIRFLYHNSPVLQFQHPPKFLLEIPADRIIYLDFSVII